jgi:hypothetical protein
LIANVAGKKIWLAIQNYWPKWFSSHGLKEPVKWMDSCQGNSQYMGWHEIAYVAFNLICRQIKKKLSTIKSQQLELCFQQKATEDYAIMGKEFCARAHWEEPSLGYLTN